MQKITRSGGVDSSNIISKLEAIDSKLDSINKKNKQDIDINVKGNVEEVLDNIEEKTQDVSKSFDDMLTHMSKTFKKTSWKKFSQEGDFSKLFNTKDVQERIHELEKLFVDAEKSMSSMDFNGFSDKQIKNFASQFNELENYFIDAEKDIPKRYKEIMTNIAKLSLYPEQFLKTKRKNGIEISVLDISSIDVGKEYEQTYKKAFNYVKNYTQQIVDTQVEATNKIKQSVQTDILFPSENPEKLEQELYDICNLIERIQRQDILSEDFIGAYTEKELLELVSLLKEVEKLSGKKLNLSILDPDNEGVHFTERFIEQFTSDEDKIDLKDRQQGTILDAINASSIEESYTALFDKIAPVVQQKINEMLSINPQALKELFERNYGLISEVIKEEIYEIDDALEEKLNSTQHQIPVLSDGDTAPAIEQQSQQATKSIQELEEELQKLAFTYKNSFHDDAKYDFEFEKNYEIANKLESILNEIFSINPDYSIEEFISRIQTAFEKATTSASDFENILKEVRKGTGKWSYNKLLNNPEGFSKELDSVADEYYAMKNSENYNEKDLLNIEARFTAMLSAQHKLFNENSDYCRGIFDQIQGNIKSTTSDLQDQFWEAMANGSNMSSKFDLEQIVKDRLGIKFGDVADDFEIEKLQELLSLLKDIEKIKSSISKESLISNQEQIVQQNSEIAKELDDRLRNTSLEDRESDPEWVENQYKYIAEYINKAEEAKAKIAELKNEVYELKTVTAEDIKNSFSQPNQIPLLSEEKSSPATEQHIEQLEREEQQALETAQAEEKLAETRNESDSSTSQSTLEQRLQTEKEKVEEVVNAEKSSFDTLITHLDTNVAGAIERKSSKFEDERDRVHDVVEAEIGELDRLIGHIEEVAPEGSINVKVDAKKSSKSSDGSESDDYNEEYAKILSSAYSDAEKTLAYDKERAEQEKEIIRLKEEGHKQELAFYEERARKEKEYSDMFISAEKERNDLIAKENAERHSRVESLYKGLNSDFTKASNKSDKYPQEYSDTLTEIQSKLQELEKYKNLDIITPEEKKDAENISKAIKGLFDELDNINKKGNRAKASSLAANIQDYASKLTKNNKVTKEAKNELEALADELLTFPDGKRISEITTRFNTLKKELKETGKEGKGLGEIFKNKLVYGTMQQLAMYFSFNDFIRYGREIFTTIRELDTALVDLQKTTTMTASELNDFYFDANDVAKRMGVTTAEIINQASAWSRLGYSSKEAATQMSELSSQFASISPGMSADEAQEGLVSIMKAWDISTDQVEREIMDNINVLGNKFAETNQDIVEGMKRSASTFAALGQSWTDSFAIFTGAQEVIQNAETVGTALKTLSLRIRGYSEETEELDPELQNITGDVIDLTKTVQHAQGVSLFTDASQEHYRSMVDYLGDISDIWDEIDEKSRTALLEKLFGKRGASVGSAILGNFDQVRKAIEEMEGAAGAADEEMKIIEESIDYKINQFKQTWVGTFQELIDRGDIGKLIDLLTNLSEVLGWVIDKAGVLGTLAIGGGLFAGIKNIGIYTRACIDQKCFEYALHA